MGILTKVFCIFCPNLVVLAWRVMSYHMDMLFTHRCTWTNMDGWTDSDNGNTWRPKLASGKNCMIVVHYAICDYIDGLGQETRNSIANALELHVFCTKPLILGRIITGLHDSMIYKLQTRKVCIQLQFSHQIQVICQQSQSLLAGYRHSSELSGKSIIWWVQEIVSKPTTKGFYLSFPSGMFSVLWPC